LFGLVLGARHIDNLAWRRSLVDFGCIPRRG
jgi:hypothetical protein